MIVIAIDGPSGSGKGTVAAYLAEQFKLTHIDSGLLYRQAALYALTYGIDPHTLTDDQKLFLIRFMASIRPENLNNSTSLRLEMTANIASKLAEEGDIRKAVVAWLHRHTQTSMPGVQGYVIDGRDIATVVFPKASAKLYITASDAIRMARRQKETREQRVSLHMAERDRRDATRVVDPLTIANDALILDTTHLSVDEACRNAAEYVTKCCFSA